MSALFSPFKLRSIRLRNRVWVSPMCQYSSINGMPTDWHLVHLGSRAIGGAGMITVEATAITPEGRISPDDSGMWSDDHIAPFARITKFISDHGAVPAVQLAHAGRKGSTFAPWLGNGAIQPDTLRGWLPLAPSAVSFDTNYTTPHEMTEADIKVTIDAFVAATQRSLKAGFKIVEIHMAHGYLLHEFLSPLSNKRTDSYGGSLENRMRFPLDIARAVRAAWPQDLPVFVRISATDWVEGGWDLTQSIALCRVLKEIGIDLVDCSSGGMTPNAKIPVAPGYQTQFAKAIRTEVGIPTGAVGLITTAQQAEEIIATQQADAVFLARAMLNDPYWALHAATELDAESNEWPNQYLRGKLIRK